MPPANDPWAEYGRRRGVFWISVFLFPVLAGVSGAGAAALGLSLPFLWGAAAGWLVIAVSGGWWRAWSCPSCGQIFRHNGGIPWETLRCQSCGIEFGAPVLPTGKAEQGH